MVGIPELLAAAIEHHRAGQLDAAERLYRQILQAEPNHASSLHLLGLIAYQKGQHLSAVECIERAVALDPNQPAFYSNLGTAYRALRRIHDAIACFRRALELKPDFAEANNNLGNALRDEGRIAEAIQCHQRAIQLRPDYAEACNNLALDFQAGAQAEQAIDCYRQALRLKPDYAEAHNHLGLLLQDRGRIAEAVDCYHRALNARPGFAEALNNLGNALQERGNLVEAVACYQRALASKPSLAEAYNNLGTALHKMGRLDESLACYRRALEIKPDYAEAMSNLVYSLPFHPSYDARMIYEETRRWDRQFGQPLAIWICPHTPDRSVRRLRVGYVSANFREHCQALYMLPLLSAHDRRRFEIVCYSDVTAPDGITAQLRSHVDRWRDIAGRDDAWAANLIREDRIDILVDLTMHMAHSRLGVFARKPAPVQVCWLAYPGTTGLSAIDYRLTDSYLDPPGLDDQYYSERSVRLPDCFWCYDPLTREPAVNDLPVLREGYITFGSLNNFCKVHDGVLRLWARVLAAVDRSRMLLLAPEGPHRQAVLDTFDREGVAAPRITFVAPVPRAQYLKLYHQIDVGLDTLPANGHTTSLDSFWMGVPVVTLVGETALGRAGACQLMNLGLPELTAHREEDFVRIAVELAGDRPRLASLRSTLRQRMETSPLMDRQRFARSIEAAYEDMWERWLTSGEPAAAAPIERARASDATADAPAATCPEEPVRFSYVITFRTDHGARAANLQAVLQWLRQMPNLEVVLVEQDSEPHVAAHELPPNCRHIFVHNEGPFNKSWGYNVGFHAAGGEVLAFGDADLILDAGHLSVCCERCLGEFDAVKPYDRLVDLTAEESQRILKRDPQIQVDRLGQKPNREGQGEEICFGGGVFLIRRAVYEELGGFDERFVGWGCEDDAMTVKIVRLVRNIWRADHQTAYHLWHERNVASRYHSSQYEQNFERLRWYGSLDLPGLLTLCQQDRAGMGNTDKFQACQQLRPRP